VITGFAVLVVMVVMMTVVMVVRATGMVWRPLAAPEAGELSREQTEADQMRSRIPQKP
jgi:hypothetical protein